MKVVRDDFFLLICCVMSGVSPTSGQLVIFSCMCFKRRCLFIGHDYTGVMMPSSVVGTCELVLLCANGSALLYVSEVLTEVPSW